ncbi:MAG: hypothetical protein Q4D16_09040 [Eubacteriales bacterium]|nr:hypothetical protein [Eubacteriales bacterium]
MKRKRFLNCILIVLLLMGVTLIPSKLVKASPTSVNLTPNKKYTAYDVTGDKKKDTVYIKTTEGKYGVCKSVAVSVNGKIAYKFTNKNFWELKAKLYTLDNGQPFLYLYAVFDNGGGPVCGLFQYQSGKLKQVINFQTLMKSYGIHQSGEIVKMNGNNVKARFYVMSYSLGPAYIDYNYVYQDGTLKPTSKTGSYYRVYTGGKTNSAFITNKTIQAYRAAGSSQKAFTLKKGNKVTIDKCWVNGKQMYIRVKYNGKSGWIKASAKTPVNNKDKQFSNVTYAG